MASMARQNPKCIFYHIRISHWEQQYWIMLTTLTTLTTSRDTDSAESGLSYYSADVRLLFCCAHPMIMP